MNPRVIMHPANLQGRDFIVGDLHGHPDVLYRLMDQVGFDVDTDRLFSVGDLVDRGPNSAAALDLLDAPWFYPVLGNHDAMLLATLNLGYLREMERAESQRAADYADLLGIRNLLCMTTYFVSRVFGFQNRNILCMACGMFTFRNRNDLCTLHCVLSHIR
ncbi:MULTISPECIES: metallophosphoesterase [Acidithiobacillus]|jgi:hypothetical protein|nr:metallophosphoesterase [Acidithiobacillus thiooxidans]